MAQGKRPIGDVQRHVLWTMIRDTGRTNNKTGTWWFGSGWYYENRSRTERIMESLRLRGLVTALDRFTTVNGCRVNYVEYTITDEGRKVAGSPDVLPARTPKK